MNKSFTVQTLSLLALLLIASSRVSAQVNPAPTFLKPIQVALPPVPDRGTPGSRGEGGSRGECLRGTQPFTAIVPSISAKPKSNVWGLTTAEHLTLFAYVPFAPKCSTLEFTLRDSVGKLIYQSPIAVPTKASLIQIRVPTSAPALELNTLYRWMLQATVTPKSIGTEETRQKPDLYSVNGWVQRASLNPTLRQQIQQAEPRQRVRLYAENGIWFDAVTTLAEARLANPKSTELAKDWEQLLQAVKLEAFATAPIAAKTSSQPKVQQSKSGVDLR